jgi:hypothetical protein
VFVVAKSAGSSISKAAQSLVALYGSTSEPTRQRAFRKLIEAEEAAKTSGPPRSPWDALTAMLKKVGCVVDRITETDAVGCCRIAFG